MLVSAVLYEKHRDTYCRQNPTEEQCNKRQETATVAVPNKAPIPDPNPERDEWRSEQDLEAQRDMAQWALLMAIAAIITVSVTAAGVFYIKRTLDATLAAVAGTEKAAFAAESAVAVTRESAELQLRAYINVVTADVIFEGTTLTVKIDATNTGQTPAKNVRHRTRGLLTDDKTAHDWGVPGIEDDSPRDVGANGSIPGGIIIEDMNAGIDPRTTETGFKLHVWGKVTYTDVFGCDRETSYRMGLNRKITPKQYSMQALPEGNHST